MGTDGRPRIALVLAGGGARGAYEAGVLAYLLRELPRRIGKTPVFDIVSGASVGAIHASYWLATLHEDPEVRAERLTAVWDSMSLEHVYHLRLADLLRIPLQLVGRSIGMFGTPERPSRDRLPGLLDTAALERLVTDRIPWEHLRGNLEASGSILCVSATEISSGRAIVFVDGKAPTLAPWEYDPYVVARMTEVTALHTLASAAIPLLFPAVRVGDFFYCDGGLRLNTPLSPALRLGADRLLVVALRHPPETSTVAVQQREQAYSNPTYLFGKVLNALLLDHVDYDLQRMRLVNSLLVRGQEVFGPEFLPKINDVIEAQRGTGYRVVEECVIRPSEDLGRIAGRCYAQRTRSLQPARVVADLLVRSAAGAVPYGEADLLSYVLFDATYARELFALGQRDAAEQVDALEHLFR